MAKVNHAIREHIQRLPTTADALLTAVIQDDNLQLEFSNFNAESLERAVTGIVKGSYEVQSDEFKSNVTLQGYKDIFIKALEQL